MGGLEWFLAGFWGSVLWVLVVRIKIFKDLYLEFYCFKNLLFYIFIVQCMNIAFMDLLNVPLLSYNFNGF